MPSPRSAIRGIQGSSSSLLVRSRLYSRLLLRFIWRISVKGTSCRTCQPASRTLELVCAWHVHHGIRSSSVSTMHGGSWLTVTKVLVFQANQFFVASYQIHRNLKTKAVIIRTASYALPAVLYTCIRTVAPTTYFPSTWGLMRQTIRKRSFGAAPAQAQAVSGKHHYGVLRGLWFCISKMECNWWN